MSRIVVSEDTEGPVRCEIVIDNKCQQVR